jgi:putative membrane protein
MKSAKLISTAVLVTIGVVACSKQGSSPEPESNYTASNDPMLTEPAPRADPLAEPAPGTTVQPGIMPEPVGGTTEPSIAKPATGVAGIQPSTPTPLTDGQIAKVAEAVDKGEIEQAREVQKKAKNPQVKKLAAQLMQHHTKNKQKAETLAKKEELTLEDSAVADQLSAKAAQNLESIKAASAPADAERTYVEAQIAQHEEVLDLLDKRLIPSAVNADLKAQLEQTRKMVESHIEEARKVKQAISGAPAVSGAPAG